MTLAGVWAGREFGAFNRDTTAVMLSEQAKFARLPVWMRARDASGEDVDDGIDQTKRLLALRKEIVSADEAAYRAAREEGKSHQEAVAEVLGEEKLVGEEREKFLQAWEAASKEQKEDFVERLSEASTFIQTRDLNPSTKATSHVLLSEVARGEFGPALEREWEAYKPKWARLVMREHLVKAVRAYQNGESIEGMTIPPPVFDRIHHVDQERGREHFLETVQTIGHAAKNPATMRIDPILLRRVAVTWMEEHNF